MSETELIIITTIVKEKNIHHVFHTHTTSGTNRLKDTDVKCKLLLFVIR